MRHIRYSCVCCFKFRGGVPSIWAGQAEGHRQGHKSRHIREMYDQRLKSEYAGGDRAENKLAVKDASVKTRLELSAVVHKARAGRPNRGPFLEFCETCESLNQSEVVGIFRHCLTSVCPSAGADMLDTSKVVTKMVWKAELGQVLS